MSQSLTLLLDVDALMNQTTCSFQVSLHFWLLETHIWDCLLTIRANQHARWLELCSWNLRVALLVRTPIFGGVICPLSGFKSIDDIHVSRFILLPKPRWLRLALQTVKPRTLSPLKVTSTSASLMTPVLIGHILTQFLYSKRVLDLLDF